MRRSQRIGALAGLCVVATLALTAAPALAGGNGKGGHRHRPPKGDPIEVIAEGLEGPFGLSAVGGHLLVTQQGSGPGTGELTLINPRGGKTWTVLDGLTGAVAADDVDGRIAFVTGEAQEPGATGGSTVYVTRRVGQTPKALADLLAHELANNPDGQLQFDPETGEPLDALSNPFDVVAQPSWSWKRYVMVADAGANSVLSIDSKGGVKTFFVPPLVTTGPCAGAPNNDPEHLGCDSVPTGLAYGPRNTLYVSTLSAEAPGEGRVYVLDARTAKVKKVISGLTGPTGVAVGDHGEVYVSEAIHGAPPGPPPGEEPPPGEGPEGEAPPAEGEEPPFDPSTIGRIVRIDRDGTRTYASVTMPVGLEFHHGSLYSTAWSLAGLFLGIPEAGQVVKVNRSAFGPELPTPGQT